MRVLTVRQPWAWAIIHGGKDVENRVRNIAGDYRGPVAIHAGLAVFEEEGGGYSEVVRAIESEIQGYRVSDDYLWEVADDLEPEDPRFVYGAILGVVDLVGVHDPRDALFRPTADVDGTCSKWAEHGAHHLLLANPRPLATPIPFKGALGLRTLSADFEAAIREQTEGGSDV
ncbi:hypothetical protein HQQ85_15870 [Herbiconiux sp. VKM Ac-2851]|nr:hypothetical protein [Herbiconiux sp. VKM Ac-2851]